MPVRRSFTAMKRPSFEPPAELGSHAGLAYSLWLPPDTPAGGVLILHGAGSCKESHHDFARACRGAGFAALAFDLPGHGDSEGELGDNVLDDLDAMATKLGARPLALRGSSMGGYLALVGAARVSAEAVVAICPAGAEHLVRGLNDDDELGFKADRPALERFLASHDAGATVEQLTAPLLLLHAEGDERIPVEHSRALRARAVRSREPKLVALPGGHHRSVQHDPEMQGVALRFIARAFESVR
jgi:alpha-beta hydrolase superfamily lysophospholipase